MASEGSWSKWLGSKVILSQQSDKGPLSNDSHGLGAALTWPLLSLIPDKNSLLCINGE